MEALFWASTPMLQTITAHDGVAASCAATVKAALAAALPTAAEYLALYEQYAPLVKLDVPKWIEEYEARDGPQSDERPSPTSPTASSPPHVCLPLPDS